MVCHFKIKQNIFKENASVLKEDPSKYLVELRQSFSGANPQKSPCQSKQANPVWFHSFAWQRLWSPKIDFEESIPPG
jgi:hypothetical protein